MKITCGDRFLGLVGAWFLHRYSSQWDARLWGADSAFYPKSRNPGGPYMYAFWHEYILLPVSFFGHCNVATITSKHHDAEIATLLSRHMGFRIFRGSTTRGGTEALRSLLAAGKEGAHLTMMPDGPKGPRRTMSLGTVYAASKLGFPIIPTGMGVSHAWRANSWDRFAIPKPFSRIRFVMKDAIFVPDRLSRKELEEYRGLAEEKLHEVTLDAENWALTGNERSGEVALDHRPMYVKAYRIP
ncbi:MAG: lysophospholipid acyltransferase family protein [Planctomycetia bacterium]|nr:lysophospholipid acyltransferase family protein [Planctomycetia bacterium]